MTYSYSYATTDTFTITHARKLASKVAADMYLCQLYYRRPSSASIDDYLEELAQLLNGGFVDQYEFGFERGGGRIVSWRYRVDRYGNLTADDRPGKVLASVDVSGATYYNFLWYSDAWDRLSAQERQRIRERLPVSRSSGSPPGDGAGYWVSDKNYSAGGQSLGRQTFRPY